MNNANKIKLLTILLALFFICSCASRNAKKWEELKDRDFYFQKFKYSEKGINKNKALEFMKRFPTGKILKILSHKYNINIDSSEFEDFLVSNKITEIKTKGLITDIEFIWQNKNKHENTIEFDYNNFLPNAMGFGEETEYIISLEVNDRNMDTFMGKIISKTPVLVTIANNIGYSRLNENSDDFYINKENKSVVCLTSAAAMEKNIISKESIKKEIKEFMNTMKQDEKKKFRDDIIKFLYNVIE
jgi:hypothetical protein